MATDIIAKMLGTWASEINVASTALKAALAILMAAILGCERAQNRHAAGVRTLIVLSVGSMLAGMADVYFISELHASFSFMAAAVLIGIAVITTNTIIFSSKNQIKGLTSSVGLWAMAIISTLLGIGLYTSALIGFAALMIGLLAFTKLELFIKNKSNHLEIHVELKTRDSLGQFMGIVREFGLKIDNIESNPAFANSGLAVYSLKLTIIGKDLKKKGHDDIIKALSVLDCVHYIERI